MPISNKIFAIVAALTISLPAMANNGFTPSAGEVGGTYHTMPGGLSHAQVQAELTAARHDGSLEKMSSEAGYAAEVDHASGAQSRTRQEVLMELQRAREDGSLQRMSRNRS